MINNVTLIGRLTHDPDCKYTKNGKAIAKFSLAVDRNYKDNLGNKVTDFIPVQAWGKTAELVTQFLQKGQLAAVLGSIEISKYEKDGQQRSFTSINAFQVQFLDKPQYNNSQPQLDPKPQSEPSTPDDKDDHSIEPDLPF